MTPRTRRPSQRRAIVVAGFLAAGFVAVAAMGWLPPALACKCAPPPPVATAVAGAAAVFEGRVVASTASDAGDEGSAYQVDFAVLRVLKGVPPGTPRLALTAWRGGCEFDFVVGRSYVIYASQPLANVLTTNVCSRTRVSERAAEDLAAFQTPVVPSPPAQHPPAKGGCAISPDDGRFGVRNAGLVGTALLVLALRRRGDPRARR